MTAQILNVAVHSPTQPNRYGCILQRERQRYAQCCTDSFQGIEVRKKLQTMHLMSLSANSTSTKIALPPCCIYDVKQKNSPRSLSSSTPTEPGSSQLTNLVVR
jgi:hypothetical protein